MDTIALLADTAEKVAEASQEDRGQEDDLQEEPRGDFSQRAVETSATRDKGPEKEADERTPLPQQKLLLRLVVGSHCGLSMIV